jgi:hypothetical protein
VRRIDFDREYWAGSSGVPESIKREFYSDYLASQHTVAEYIRATCGDIEGVTS